ncbi:DUF4265 domain-containing protein [Streptomyces sp. ISL-94]|uniref:DUF4265 domain-containing protein n=1 Tax=Streptomyces sp. ISL-94 TaxID=2819190 RepID=UPI001BE6FAA1|nr:DUF4265 domain-containing protein [Streptomyces sp. ISL-94]MBT2482038.1 DUF4265 domain-containing protein [Streptomyces sp. ISL-94]
MTERSERPISASGAKTFKVAFDLEAEGADWPPVSVERLWGEKTDVRFEIRVLNTPFFVRGIAFGDLIAVRPDHERRELVYESFTAESGNSTVRIIFMRNGDRRVIENGLREAGCSWESISEFANLVAVDIPADIDYRKLRKWLLAKVESQDIELQESAVSAVHRGQLPHFP